MAVGTHCDEMVGPFQRKRHSKSIIPKLGAPCWHTWHYWLLLATNLWCFQDLALFFAWFPEGIPYDSNSKLQNLDMSIHIYIISLTWYVCMYIYMIYVYCIYIPMEYICGLTYHNKPLDLQNKYIQDRKSKNKWSLPDSPTNEIFSKVDTCWHQRFEDASWSERWNNWFLPFCCTCWLPGYPTLDYKNPN